MVAPPAKTSPASLAAAVLVAEEDGMNEYDELRGCCCCWLWMGEPEEGTGDDSEAMAAKFVDGDLAYVSRDDAVDDEDDEELADDEWIIIGCISCRMWSKQPGHWEMADRRK